MHYLLTIRREAGVVLTVAIGPKSALVPPSRMGRLLAADPSGSPLYRLTLSPAPSTCVSLFSKEKAVPR